MSQDKESKAKAPTSFRLPPDVRDWLDEIQKAGQSPAKVVTGLIRKEMERQQPANLSEHEKDTREWVKTHRVNLDRYERALFDVPFTARNDHYQVGVKDFFGENTVTMTVKELNEGIADAKRELAKSAKWCLIPKCDKPRNHHQVENT
ncbi:hypothetical protein AUI06_10135 [archaeon 13_2_20CM_2_52_21]|nr:MAG: hypothetical protein AUI06_10135 [archaeon 13_2_20CM_2_52_21]